MGQKCAQGLSHRETANKHDDEVFHEERVRIRFGAREVAWVVQGAQGADQ